MSADSRKIRHLLRLTHEEVCSRPMRTARTKPNGAKASRLLHLRRHPIQPSGNNSFALCRTPKIHKRLFRLKKPLSGKHIEKPQRRTKRKYTVARYVSAMAQRHGIRFVPTYADRWADTVTRLTGDDVRSDATDDLLVALTRAGKLAPMEMIKLVIQHHREARRF